MKYALITGGTKGIGRATALQLLERGFSVLLIYGNDDISAFKTKNDFEIQFSDKVHLLKFDLSRTDIIVDLYDSVCKITNQLEVLILNAAITNRKNFEDLTISEWELVLSTNLTTPFFIIQKFVPLMTFNSNIIFTGSSMAIYPHALSIPYAITKAGVHSLVRNLVKSLASKGIRINGIAPGFIETEWQRNKPEEIRNNIINKISLKRFGMPEEIAKVFIFIIENPYLNGEIISIDGGYSYQ